MQGRDFFVARGVILAVLLAAGLLVAGFFALNKFIYTEKQGEGNDFEPYRGTLSGEYVCLPHIDTEGPQTDECAFGLKTDTGEYYGVDFALMSQVPPELEVGDRFSASGVITPIERLSADHWRQYPIEGIFSVTDSAQVLE